VLACWPAAGYGTPLYTCIEELALRYYVCGVWHGVCVMWRWVLQNVLIRELARPVGCPHTDGMGWDGMGWDTVGGTSRASFRSKCDEVTEALDPRS
jgi:hypothetical protein